MTDNQQAPAVKQTAMQVATEARDAVGEVRAELGNVRAEWRDFKESSATPVVDITLRETVRQNGQIVNELADFVNAELGKLRAQPAGVAALDPAPFNAKIEALEKKTGESFTNMANRVNEYSGLAREAIERVETELAEVRGKVKGFDEAGVAPASGEDIDALNARLQAVEAWSANVQLQTATGNPRPVSRVAEPGVPKIYAQVHELMRLVTQMGKDKTADQKMGGYAYRSIDAAMSAVGHAMRDVGVMFIPGEILDKRIERYTTEQVFGNGQSKILYWTHVWITQRYKFVSLIDGSEIDAIEMDGEARDNGDKSTSKADSMRLKYALLQSLMIPITGLPESDGSDGTEGYVPGAGRGPAEGESFENATPARQYPQKETQEYRERHAAEQTAPPAEDRTPEQKAAAALNALATLKHQRGNMTTEAVRGKFTAILGAINDQGLGEFVVSGTFYGEDVPPARLIMHANAVNAVISTGVDRG